MDNLDTIKLLKECNSGSKMAVSSLEEVIEKVKHNNLKEFLIDNKKEHEKLGNKIHEALHEEGKQEKDPNPLIKGMAYVKMSMKYEMDSSDETLAELLTDGTDMGIKTLCKKLHSYANASTKAKELCKELIEIEEKLRQEVKIYL